MNNAADLWHRAANLIFWFAVIYVCWYKLWLSAALPFTMPMGSTHDGTWFFKAALSIYSGNWFGETYNHFTLIKAPIYPLFLTSLAEIGVHPKIALDMLYVGASLVFLAAMRTAICSRFAVFVGFFIVLANPITFSDYWAYPLRLNFFMPLVLIYLSSILALIAQSSGNEPAISFRWSLLCSVSLALAWYTREEAIWMIAALAPMVLLSVRCFWRKQERQQILVFWLMIFLLPNMLGYIFSSINEDSYGFDGVLDTRAPEFSRAINAIYSLNTLNDDTYDYLTFETRDKLKAISENTRRVIEPLLDSAHGGYSHFGTGIGGSYASWAIRDSMYSIGYYRNPESTESAYKVIADDIEEYCRQENDNCRRMYVSGVLVKPISWSRFSNTIHDSVFNLIEYTPYPPADRTLDRNRGDRQYQYIANRLFNFNTSWDVKIEEKAGILKVEKQRMRKINRLYTYYSDGFYILVLLALVSAVTALFSPKLEPKLIALLLFGSCAASYSVYLLISLFAVPGFDRLLAIVSIPLLSLTAYFLALLLQQSMAWLSNRIRGV